MFQKVSADFIHGNLERENKWLQYIKPQIKIMSDYYREKNKRSMINGYTLSKQVSQHLNEWVS
jgi:hypothetical protein